MLNRDIKPANVLLMDDGRIVLIDVVSSRHDPSFPLCIPCSLSPHPLSSHTLTHSHSMSLTLSVMQSVTQSRSLALPHPLADSRTHSLARRAMPRVPWDPRHRPAAGSLGGAFLVSEVTLYAPPPMPAQGRRERACVLYRGTCNNEGSLRRTTRRRKGRQSRCVS